MVSVSYVLQKKQQLIDELVHRRQRCELKITPGRSALFLLAQSDPTTYSTKSYEASVTMISECN